MGMRDTVIITNNPLVQEIYGGSYSVRFHDGAHQMEILREARDLIHLGAALITHPMLGRVKPHETPYKSVFLEHGEESLHTESLIIIEDSIAETAKYTNGAMALKYDEALLPDLQFIDLQLLKSGVEEYERS